jgi:prevent-host-death family protein
MRISVSEAHTRLSRWLDKVKDEPVTITRRGKPVGIIVSPDEYERLRQVKAYLQMLRLSGSLRKSGLTANELAQSSRDELEERL